MFRIKKVITFIATLFVFTNCQNNFQITDLIEPIKVVSGISDSVFISDIYYSASYNPKFRENEFCDLTYDSEKKMLFIKTLSQFEGAFLLEFEEEGESYVIPIISKKAQKYKFTYEPDKSYKLLTVFGNFNGWNRTALPMLDENNDGIYEVDVIMDPGIYQYKFYGDGEEIVDPLNPDKVPNGTGSFNSIRTIEDSDTNILYLHIDEYISKNPKSTFSFYIEDQLEGELTVNNIIVLLNNKQVSQNKISLDGNFLGINFNYDELNNETLRVIVTKNGRVSNIQTIMLNNGKPLENDAFTWNDGIIYSLMIDRFYDGDKSNNNPVQHDSLSDKANYQGGDLEGIIQKLQSNYFNELGVNVIWISPVLDNPNEAYKEFPAPHRYYSGYHGYWPISSTKVDEHFGNIDLVKKLINLAHEKEIKVLLDFVSNHVHTEHPYFKENREWFGKLELPDGRLNLRFWDEYRLTTWFEPYLASFDYLGSDEALEEMTDIAVWWLNETGADGFRHDAVKHVPNKFWRRLNEKIREQVASKRELPVYQIGETFGSYELINSYVNNGQLNSQFNFNLYDIALQTFVSDASSFLQLNKEIHKTFSVYGINHLMGNVMDSHDKNRFMAFADGDLAPTEWSAIEQGWNNPPFVDDPANYKKLILYMTYMNTIPGLPVIYYGSEFGMSGASDPDNRRMMRFEDNLSIDEKRTKKEVAKIINLRKNHSALRRGDFYPIKVEDNIYAYLRSDMNERILVVLNKGKDKRKINLELPEYLDVNSIKDLKEKKEINLNISKLNLDLSGMDWGIYLLQ